MVCTDLDARDGTESKESYSFTLMESASHFATPALIDLIPGLLI